MPDHETSRRSDTASKSESCNYAMNGSPYFNPATPVYYAYYISRDSLEQLCGNETVGTPTIRMLHDFLMRTIPNSAE
jgi:hypothetical protein